MQDLNSIQEKRILEFINGQEKDLDKINQHINDIIVLSGLTNSEIAALLFTLMRNTLAGGNNKELLERINVKDVNQLGITGVLEIQKLLVNEYNKILTEKDKPKDGKPKPKRRYKNTGKHGK